MSYAAKDISQQESNPVLLFEFASGSQVWRYAAAPETLSKGGRTWGPEAIICGPIAHTGDVPKDQIDLKLPITNPVAALFLSYAPDAVTTVTIYRTNFDDEDLLTIWMGRVAFSSVSVATVSLQCEPVFTSLRRMGLQATYSRMCRHRLFGPGCNVNPATYAVANTVTSLSGAIVGFASLTGDFKGGTLKSPNGSIFFIVEQNSTTITLMRHSSDLAQNMVAHPSGFAVTLYPGCDHSTSGCATYNNFGNFGGWPGIPRINPFNTTTRIF